MKRWYVVQTQPGREQDAARELEQQGFETFAPTFRLQRQVRRHVLFVPRPLFPGYGFVAFDLASSRWRVINGTRGVVRLMCEALAGEPRPVPVPKGVVEAFQTDTDEDGFWHDPTKPRDDAPWLRLAGRQVRVAEGPFAGFPGLCQKSDAERVKVLLDIFGRPTPVEVDWQDVEVVG